MIATYKCTEKPPIAQNRGAVIYALQNSVKFPSRNMVNTFVCWKLEVIQTDDILLEVILYRLKRAVLSLHGLSLR